MHTIWVHLRPFGCLTELGAKRAELVQKFMPRSRIGIFRDEGTQSTALDPKLTFWCISYYLGALGTVWLPYRTWCKTGRTSAKVRDTKSQRNFSPRINPIHPIGPQTHILVCFLLFGCIRDRLVALRNSAQNGPNKCKSSCHEVASEFFATNASDPPHFTLNEHFGAFHSIKVHSEPFGCLTKLGAKRAELVQTFVPRSRVGIFRNERTRSNPLDPKPTFWCVLYHLGAFGTVWLPYETRCKTGRTRAKVRATKSRRNFSQRMQPIHSIGP